MIKDPSQISDNLQLDERGIWVSKAPKKISFPSQTHNICPDLGEFSFWFQHRKNIIRAILKRFSPPGTLFDIGGGNGFNAKAIQDIRFPVYLVEPTIEGIMNSLDKGLKGHVIFSDIDGAGFHNNSLDAISMFDVIEHIEDDRRFLKKANSLLSEGGRLYLTVPAYNWLWSDKDDYAGHFRRYTLNNLEKVLKDAGFSIEFSTYIFSLLPVPIFFLKTLPRLIRGKKELKNYSKKRLKEHGGRKGFISILLTRLFRFESGKISKGQRIKFGGTCFVVARRGHDNKEVK